MLKPLIFILSLISSAHASVDWSENAKIPLGETRENIYRLIPSKFKEYQKSGYLHALHYPVSVSGLMIPYEPLDTVFNEGGRGPIGKLIYKLTKKKVPFNSYEELYQWLGLPPYPKATARGIYRIPYPNGVKPDYYMGTTIKETRLGKGLTFSCATCHSTELFGKSVMGLTNKRVRANRFFNLAKKTVPLIPAKLFQMQTGATEDEYQQFKRTQKNLGSVYSKVPEVLGLDTSLSQVALSLSRRMPDEYATKSKFYERFPRQNTLSHFVADSKPMPWWNLKYKTRWLADGSIVSGNPVHTNFLWNEIGRGTDLRELELWMQKNQKTIDELTAAVFSTKAPKWTDFFPVETLSLEKAKRGEKHFLNSCKKCHGEYRKAWNLPHADQLTKLQKLETTKVLYHEKTPVKDVGTDPNRYLGMRYFSKELNQLSISKWMGTKVVPQRGYVPPPLVGVWARYPYFHNNSIPNLCALLTKAEFRPKVFYQGPAKNIETDYDSECVGYPTGDRIPESWKKEKRAKFDVSKPGLSNSGHTKAFLNEDGSEKYSFAEKMELIEFLKTL